ncbi:hypothetical protein [Caudoviricetes sp.]|nr:hypothetical protein [Caudoviricetes sp.]
MAFIYNLTDSWNDVTTTWNGIKLAVTDTGSSATSKLLNLTVTGSSTASFVVDKNGNLALNGTVNKITMTAPATGATLTLADGSSFITSGAHSATFTFSGTTTLTFPTSGTVTALGNTTTGSGSIVLATSPTLVTPNLGTPSAITLTNGLGLPISTGLTGTGTGVLTALAVNVGSAGAFVTFNGALGTPSSGNLANCTGYPPSSLSGINANAATWLVTPSSANLAAAVTDETGSGSLVFATSPTLVTPALGTPTSVNLTNGTNLPISTGVDGLGTGVATFLATPSSANLASAVTDETGSGPLVFATSPTFTSQVTLGTQSTTRGTLVLANTTAGSKAVTLQSSNSTAAAYTLTFPAAAPVNGYYLQTDTNGVLSWAAGGGGGGGSPGGSNTQVQFNNAGAFGGDAAFTFVNGTGTATMELGVASTTSAALKLYNSSSANGVTIASGNNSSAWTMTLPTSGGSANYFLQTDGSGNTTWAAAAAGTISTGTIGQITYYSGTNTLSGTTTGTGVLTALGNNTNSASGVAVLNGSGYLAVAQGGTGLGSGTSGGVLYYSASGTLASSAALAASALVVGGGAGVAPSTVTTGTGVVTALGVNTGSAGAFVVNGGALGTPSSGTLTNCTSVPVNQATGVLPVANGGTNASSAGITAFNNITGYTATGATGTTSTNLVFSTSPTLVTPTLGVASATSINKVAITAPATSATLTIADGKTLTANNTLTLAATNDSQTYTLPAATCNIGYLEVPQNSKTTSYTTVLADSGKHIYANGTSITITIDSNANVAYATGTVLTFVNINSTSLTIAITTDTLYLAGAGTTGSRTLAQYGIATAIKLTSTTWLISGTGLT